ncbi:MAG: hypothetical protein Q7V43_25925 [Myxococcales bacterium]|nr:hypothetical protein [Myxococcales bacterium]
MRPRRSALLVLLLACLALCFGAPAASATPLSDTALVTLAQHTGGSFGGSRWGSGSPSSSSGSSSSGGSYSGGGYSGSSRSSGSSDFGGVWILIQIVIWCFSVSPILGFAVLGIGLAFLFFVWTLRS